MLKKIQRILNKENLDVAVYYDNFGTILNVRAVGRGSWFSDCPYYIRKGRESRCTQKYIENQLQVIKRKYQTDVI